MLNVGPQNSKTVRSGVGEFDTGNGFVILGPAPAATADKADRERVWLAEIKFEL